ncbi:MAG: glycosyltransferase family 2 protein [Bdellovibrionota bacterium]
MLSIVVPVYNEQELVAVMAERALRLDERLNEPLELLFVDDGSTDRTLERIQQLREADARIKYISFSRNFGHQTAVSAGLKHAVGDVVAVIDGDLQDPPEAIPDFVEKLRTGFDVVYAVRRQRKESALKRTCYWGFYRLLSSLSATRIPLDSGDFCVMNRRVVDTLNDLPERNRFVRGLRAWVGFNQVGLEYSRDARLAGEVKYTWRKLLRLAFDGMVSFSHRPLQLIGSAGLLIALFAFVGLALFFVCSVFDIPILGHSPREAPGYTTLTLSVLFLGGVQLVSLGIIGEYIGRIFDEVKQRPLYIVRSSGGLDREPTTQPFVAPQVLAAVGH